MRIAGEKLSEHRRMTARRRQVRRRGVEYLIQEEANLAEKKGIHTEGWLHTKGSWRHVAALAKAFSDAQT